MTEPCGAEHPTDSGVDCSKPYHPYGSHFHAPSKTVWPGTAAPVRKGRGASRLTAMANAIPPVTRTGPPVSSRDERSR